MARTGMRVPADLSDGTFLGLHALLPPKSV